MKKILFLLYISFVSLFATSVQDVLSTGRVDGAFWEMGDFPLTFTYDSKLYASSCYRNGYDSINSNCLGSNSSSGDYGNFSFLSWNGSTITSEKKTHQYDLKYWEQYVVIDSCRDGDTLVNGQCSPCPAGQVMIDGQCQTPCQDGEYRKNGVCVPFCYPPFHYVFNNNKIYCVASDLDKSSCLQHDYFWFDNTAFHSNPFLDILPTGCYYSDIENMYINSMRSKLSLALSISNIPGLGITLKSAGSSIIANFKRIFAGAKSLYDFIKDKFSSNNSNDFQDLSNQNIKIQDLKMSDDGVEPIIDLTPLEDLPEDVSWHVPDDRTNYDGFLPTDDFDFSPLVQSAEEFDNLPAEIPEFTDNIIGTKNILDTAKDISSYLDSATEINTPVKAKIDISDSLVKPTQTRQFDLDTIKIAEDNTGTYPITKYKQTIKYPDSSVTTLDIIKTDMGENGQTYDITTTTPLSNGDTFEKTYHIQKAQDGSITNTLHDPATMTKVNPDGSTDIVPNASPDTTISTKTGTSLVPITNELKTIETKQDFTNQQLQKIDNRLKDMIDYVPLVNDDFDQSLKNFKDALTDYDVNISNFLGYLSNFKQSLEDLKTNFDNAKNTLENKPSFTQNTGSCGFTVHAFKHDFQVDPCMFVTPYRPILVVFFTLMGTFAVIMFAVKFLISKGGE